MRKNSGFTLVEILIALLIFAILGVLAASGLRAVIRVHRTLKKTDHEVMQVMMTMTLLRRDISQTIDRPVRDSANSMKPAFSGESDAITFTRTGLINPFQTSRQSDMQRVGYALNGGKLVRLTWDVLDPAKETKPQAQVMLDHVQSITWQFIAPNGKKSSSWPPPVTVTPQTTLQSIAPPPLPAVVLMVMQVENQGVIQGVFPIPARGVNATQLQAQTPAA